MQLRKVLSIAVALNVRDVLATGQLDFALENTNPDDSCKNATDSEADLQAITNSTDSTLFRDILRPILEAGHAILCRKFCLPRRLLVYRFCSECGRMTALTNERRHPSWLQISSNMVTQSLASQWGLKAYREARMMLKGSIGFIGDMKKTFSHTQIGSVDSWNCWSNGSIDGIIESGLDLAHVRLLRSL